MKTKIALVAFIATSAFSGVAQAGCRGDMPISRVVYSQVIKNDATGTTATTTYTVEGIETVCESGSASNLNPLHGWHPIDTRACHYHVTQRYIVRNVIVERRGMQPIPVGLSRSAYPDITRDKNDNCNSTINSGAVESLKSEAFGTKDTWQPYIDADAEAVRNILVLVGAISS